MEIQWLLLDDNENDQGIQLKVLNSAAFSAYEGSDASFNVDNSNYE